MSENYVISEIEREYILSLLEQERRIDGRDKLQFRPVKIETGLVEKAEGSAVVSLGETKVIVGVKATLGAPFPDSPDSGVITTGAELSPIASPYFESGPPDDDAIELARVTDRAIRESHCVDLSKLCIIPGKWVWILFIDIYVLNDDGNLFDASTLGAVAALATARIPKVVIKDNEEVEIVEGEYEDLKVDHYPVSVTTYKIGNHRIVDANIKEERISDARLTFAFDEEGHVVSAQKGKAGVFTPEEVFAIVDEASKVSKDLRTELMKALKKE